MLIGEEVKMHTDMFYVDASWFFMFLNLYLKMICFSALTRGSLKAFKLLKI